MTTELLKTKLYVPVPASTVFARPRLTAQLDLVLSPPTKLALIAAPPGYGKTALVSGWLHSTKDCAFAWLSLDATDNDPTRFWLYVLAAFASLDVPLEDQTPILLQTPQPGLLESVITALINALTSVPRTLVLVLDDYHVIENHAIHESVTFFCEHLPANTRLVLTTRVDPPLPLARWRARAELTEIRAHALKFTLEEEAAFLNQPMGLNLAPEDIARLDARTEGWIAGLQLAALSLQQVTNRESFLREFTGNQRYIIDYLVEEVLTQQDEATRTFLLQTCILERFNSELCDVVTQQTDSPALLDRLERSHLFLISLDAAGEWYRYHHLFADVLRNRLKHLRRAEVPQLHERASQWLEQHGLFHEAIQHALAGHAFGRAAELIEKVADSLLNRGETATLQGWLNTLPEEELRARPRLCLARANAFVITNELDAAETWVFAAERGSPQSAEGERLLVEAAALRAGLALYRNDLPRTIELAQKALAGLPPENLRLRGTVLMYLGFAYGFSDQLEAARDTFTESARRASASADWHTALIAMQNQAWIYFLQGKLHRAAEVYRQALAMAAERGASQLPGIGGVHWELGRVLYEWNDLAGAELEIRTGMEHGERGKLPRMLLFSSVFMSRLCVARGDLEEARVLLERARSLVDKFDLSLRYEGNVRAEQVRLWLANGDLDAASAWPNASGLGLGTPPDYLHEVLLVAAARALSAQGNFKGAIELLTRLINEASAVGRNGTLIECLALQALALQQVGERQTALARLETALRLGEPENYTRTFVDEGALMRALLVDARPGLARQARVATGGVAPCLLAYLDRLLAAFPSAAPVRGNLEVVTPKSAMVDALSPRELEVLQLVAAGLNNREIAAKLFLSVGTVKKHINNIFAKLGAARRAQAVACARDLGLL